MSAILNKLSDLTCKDSILRHALAQGLFKLTSLVKIPIFDSELEITSYYSTVLTIIKRGLFVITTLDSRLRKFSAQSGGHVSGMRFSKSSAEPEGYPATSSASTLLSEKTSSMDTESIGTGGGGSHFLGGLLEEQTDEQEDLDPQEAKEMAAHKRRELDILQSVVGLAAKIVKLHPSVSMSFCRGELFQGIFRLISSDVSLHVHTQLT